MKFLTIELDDINAVPKVYYKGEEVTMKARVSFDWQTATEQPELNSPHISIEHAVTDEEKPYVKRIEYNPK